MRLPATFALSALLHAALLLWLLDPGRDRQPIVIEAAAVDLVFDEEAAEAAGPVPPVTTPMPLPVEPPGEAVPVPPSPPRPPPPVALPVPPGPALPALAFPPPAAAVPVLPPAFSQALPLVDPAPVLPPPALVAPPAEEGLPPSAAAVTPIPPPALPARLPDPPPVALLPPALPPPPPDPEPASPSALAALPAAEPEAPDQPAAVPAAPGDALPSPPPAMPTLRLSAGLQALPTQRPRTGEPAGLSRGPIARDTGCGGAFTFPEAARRLGAEGTVVLQIAVGADGAVTSAEVLQGSGFPVLDRAARQAALRCRFEPALERGRPVAGAAPWRVTYRLPR